MQEIVIIGGIALGVPGLLPVIVSLFLRDVEAGTIRLVSWLQGRLNEIAGAGGHGVLDGRPLAVDGDFGPRTEKVVKVFQEHRALQPTGIVGPKTRAKL